MLRPRLLFLLALLQVFHATAISGSSCRCLYGDPCWPSQSKFDKLSAQVSQPLLFPTPAAQACYTSPDSAECTEAVAQWGNGNWRANHTGAMQSPNFETFTFSNGTIEGCYLNTTLGLPCGRGSVSVIAVDARSVSDVQAAVNFAAVYNLRLAIKNTGHDYLGRSDGRGSFMLWTHNMKNITVHPSFTPAGAPTNESYEYAITLEAGVQWHEAYSAANDAGRVLVGGASGGGSVGAAGGWIQGGGHSALSASFGLGVDNVLEISVVTSNGSYLVTNAYQHPDLFWALRGGGGGTYAVATSVTYRTRPSFPVIGAFLSASINTSSLTPNAALSAAFTELVRITPQLTDQGWGGYSMFKPSNSSVSFVIRYVVPDSSPESAAQANATMSAYLTHVQELAANATQAGDSTVVQSAYTASFASWWDWYVPLFSTGESVGFNVELGSWLLPRDVVESDHEHVAETLVNIPAISWYLVCGGAASNVSADAAGINPAWRKAVVHVVGATTWSDGATLEEINAAREILKSDTAKMRALAPESGAYYNEASPYEPNPAQAFFGSHYNKLRAIKAVYDPINLFVVTEGVGSDEWDDSLTCRK
ncbi:FAD-binding domain-containing protein [Polyporus arcularius HHB13444]|uniref:FAD-binding domain-containing protein n=1 Tax=Polyporus arcularius HHB13444 TaxID=1314778 RepID=A0A5C3PW01_9APHY|nr:FAD-binding domain-containing protein [Polyporus arcularius HHB13444]